MKKNIFIYFVLLSIATSQAQWYLLDTGNNELLNELYTINADTVVVVGNNGTILRTVNGGIDWTHINSYASVSLRNIKFYDTQTGYISGNNGIVLKTTDGGETWQIIALNTTEDLLALSVESPTHLYVGGTNGFLMESTDGGLTWNPVNTPTSENIVDMQFFGDTGYILSNDYGNFTESNLYKTTDHGSTWDLKTGYLLSMYFVDADNGVFGTFGEYLITGDGADTMNSTDYNIGNGVIDVEVSETGDIWTCGVNMTTCPGPSFISKTEIINNTYQTSYAEFTGYRIDFYYNTGYMLDGSYNIYKNSTGINITGMNEYKINNKLEIYPNPANDFVQINIPENIQLDAYEIIDVQGKFVSPKKEMKNTQIDISNLSTGLYLLQVFTGKNIYTGQFIVK